MEIEIKRYKKAKRIIYNPRYNDWNIEPEYTLQNVRVYGKSKSGKSYIVDSYGKKKFSVLKSNIYFNKKDFEEKKDKIQGFLLLESQKKYLLDLF